MLRRQALRAEGKHPRGCRGGSYNFAEARIHIEKALDLNPNDTEARCYYGYFLTAAGEPDKALEQFHIARRHNPFDLSWVPWVVGQAYFGLRRYDEAIATLQPSV